MSRSKKIVPVALFIKTFLDQRTEEEKYLNQSLYRTDSGRGGGGRQYATPQRMNPRNRPDNQPDIQLRGARTRGTPHQNKIFKAPKKTRSRSISKTPRSRSGSRSGSRSKSRARSRSRSRSRSPGSNPSKRALKF